MPDLSLETIVLLAVTAGVCLYCAQDRARLLVALFLVLPFPLSLLGESGGGNVSIADCVVLLGFLTLMTRGARVAVGPCALPLAAFFSIALVSSVLSPSTGAWAIVLAIVRMGLSTAAALMLFANWRGGIETFHRCFAAYLIGLTALSGIVVLTFVAGGAGASMYTLGIHKNSLGTIFGCGVAICLAYLLGGGVADSVRRRLNLALAAAGVGLLLSLSRGGWISAAAGALFVLLITRRAKAFIISLVIVVPLLALLWSYLPEETTRRAMDVSPDTYVIRARLDAIDNSMDAFRSSPLIGVGVGLRRMGEPHNILVLTLGEMGVIGLLALLGMLTAGFYTLYVAVRRFGHDPGVRPLIVAGAAVLIVTTCHAMMDVYWRRGVGLMAWACVGMAVSLLRSDATAPAAAPRAPRQRRATPLAQVSEARGTA